MKSLLREFEFKLYTGRRVRVCAHHLSEAIMLAELDGAGPVDELVSCSPLEKGFSEPLPMKPIRVLSIRQPWAYLICRGSKDIENRTWRTSVRGRFLIHASARPAPDFHHLVEIICAQFGVAMSPDPKDYEMGGIVGQAEIVGCMIKHPSKWFEGPYGFVLRNARPLPFIKCNGRLGFFQAPAEVHAALDAQRSLKATPGAGAPDPGQGISWGGEGR